MFKAFNTPWGRGTDRAVLGGDPLPDDLGDTWLGSGCLAGALHMGLAVEQAQKTQKRWIFGTSKAIKKHIKTLKGVVVG